MATETQVKRLRRRVGYSSTDETSLGQTEADEIYLQAEDYYTNAQSVEYMASIIYLEGVLASSSKMATYRQNQTQENVSDIFTHVKDLIAMYRATIGEIETGVAAEDYGSVASGKSTRKPSKVYEYPGQWL